MQYCTAFLLVGMAPESSRIYFALLCICARVVDGQSDFLSPHGQVAVYGAASSEAVDCCVVDSFAGLSVSCSYDSYSGQFVRFVRSR